MEWSLERDSGWKAVEGLEVETNGDRERGRQPGEGKDKDDESKDGQMRSGERI